MEVAPCIYRISVKALIKNDAGAILLIREKEWGWELPGGGLEHKETIKECLTRELHEEIGVKLKSISNAPVSFWPLYFDKGPRWYAFVLYEAQIDDEPIPGEEAEEIKYFSLDEIKKLHLHVNTAPYFLED